MTLRNDLELTFSTFQRRATLLREMDRKNKVGGILDRRFGENDPTMTPEERAAERYARESQKKLRKESMFNLEDEEEDDFQLTHKGQSIPFHDAPKDDLQDGDVGGSEDDLSDSETPQKRKRIFVDDGGPDEDNIEGGEGEEEEEPERKKSKHEVMKEVISKSKFHKAERQQLKEDDADLRDELDKGLPDLFDLLRGVKPPPKEPPKDDTALMNPDRAALLDGQNPEKEYDQRLRQLTFDKRSRPTDRTKTEEEKAEEEAERLKKLDEARVRRMRGEEQSDSEEDEEEEESEAGESDEESVPDDAKAFGLQQPTSQTTTRPDMGIEDEDDFIIDDDLVETRSDASLSVGESGIEGEEDSADEEEEPEEEEDELINGLIFPEGQSGAAAALPDGTQGTEKLAFTYPCPENHENFLQTVKDVSMQDLPTVVQRIRALHHPRLHPDNKKKLGRFAEVLVQHVAYMAEEPERPPFSILENVIRHIHSLGKSHPENVSMAFRARLRETATQRGLNLGPGDLLILTAIATIFPTSDHFHAIVTPAHLCIARYLGQGAIDSLSDFATGAYVSSLFLQYQAISKRYMPEFVNYVLNALCNLCPEDPKENPGFVPIRKSQQSVEISTASKRKVAPRKLRFWDVAGPEPGKEEELKISLLTIFVKLLDTASDLWTGQSAYIEIFQPVQAILQHLRKTTSKFIPSIQDPLQSTLDKLTTHLDQTRLTRRPLLLHNHRPLAIKTAIPKFEETFNPDKHYDPNRERAESNRLRTEYKRERKGAMRELRKDANFVAREQLREKKDRDAEYERKYKKLVADVQNEEGKAANDYEREKRLRQGKK